MIQFGIDRLLADRHCARRSRAGAWRCWRIRRRSRASRAFARRAGAPAGLKLTAAFGPQHGLRGDKQDNMVESPDFVDPVHGIPVFSLYGEVRRPTDAMMDTFDVLLVDLQDLGCRIYTFITTLRYVLEAAARHGKAVWVLDRPNPAGRPVEGLLLRPGWESFVGAGPMPMRHGLTLGELARWFVASCGSTSTSESCRWTAGSRPPRRVTAGRWRAQWVNPSPNAPNLSMARCYAGTVMLEGTTLSEGRGTTRPLELFGAPDLDATRAGAAMRAGAAVARGLRLRSAGSSRRSTSTSASCARPADPRGRRGLPSRRLPAVATVARPSRRCGLRPDYPLWRDFPYEYERDAWPST